MKNTNRKHVVRDRQPLRLGLWRVVLAGQRLRADETATATTFALGYAAKWAQANGGGR